ncbi:signal peptidase II [Legionella sp. CNM-4043-24]|uniref:signal peptidase II n=1 Tax=Legionella sp. CNM-4043-24 TaxID=3421646 RepID=UPI00403AE7FF
MKKCLWFLVSLLVLLADQASKYWASANLEPYHPKALMPMLNFTLAFNTGAAFSFLNGAGGWHRWFFAVFSLVMSVVLSVWLWRLPSRDRLQCLAVSLILGGALGNLYDRARYGFVVDFIDVYYKNHHWPVFNLADSAICIGAFFLLLDFFITRKA